MFTNLEFFFFAVTYLDVRWMLALLCWIYIFFLFFFAGSDRFGWVGLGRGSFHSILSVNHYLLLLLIGTYICDGMGWSDGKWNGWHRSRSGIAYIYIFLAGRKIASYREKGKGWKGREELWLCFDSLVLVFSFLDQLGWLGNREIGNKILECELKNWKD